MTGAELYSFLYTWATGVLGATPVIRAYQNGAKPADLYVAIEDDQSWDSFGRGTSGQATTTSSVSYDYEIEPVFWEVSNGAGYGDTLRDLRQSLDKAATKAAFKAAKIGILSVGDIISMPWTSTETQIVREKRMSIRLSVSTKVDDNPGTPGAILTAETVNDLSAAA
jgi:hypothetical protein